MANSQNESYKGGMHPAALGMRESQNLFEIRHRVCFANPFKSGNFLLKSTFRKIFPYGKSSQEIILAGKIFYT